MAIIGFIVLVLLGLFLLIVASQIFFGSTMFGGSGVEATGPAILAGILLWAACHWAPFSVHFVNVGG